MNTLLLLVALLWAPPGPPAKPAAPKTPAPPVLQGTVKGPDGKPIEKALVLVRPLAARMNEPALVTRTDATGTFRLPLAGAGLVLVRVEVAGLSPRSFDRIAPGSPLHVTLQKGKTIEGVVRDAASGQAVRGARVDARAESGRLWTSWESEAGLVQATTDAKGLFRLEGLSSGPHMVTAAARGYGRATRPSVPAGGRAELFLFQGASVRGSVKGPQNQPLAGVVLRLEGSARFWTRMDARTSDAGGRFEFLGVEPGTYQLLAHHKDWALGVVGDVFVERQVDTEVDVRLEAGRRVSGRLVDGEERPVSGRVSFDMLAGEGPLRSAAELLRAEAGADGRFTIEGLPVGDHSLSAEARGYGTKRVDVQVRAADPEVRLSDVVLEPGALIRGRVRDKAGLGIASAQLLGFQTEGFRGGGPSETSSEADGSFVLAGLQAGTYRLQVRAAGYGSAQATARVGTENVDVVLEPAGSITGLVVDAAGRAVESFRANASPTRRDSGRFIMGGPGEDAGTGDGRFTLHDLAGGEYVVEVTAGEKGRGVVSGVKVAAGAAVDVGKVVLAAGGIVRGQVVDAGGAAVVGAEVSVSSGEGFGFGRQRASGSSDASGNFEILGVTPGTATASATHPGFARGQVTGLEVDPARPAEARIVMTQGGRIEGTARRRGNLPIAGAQVQAMPDRRDMWASTQPVVTASDGSFVLEHVPVGRTRVLLMAQDGAASSRSTQTREVEVQEGQTSVVEFVSREILLTGAVTRRGEPLPGVRLSLHGRGFGVMTTFALPGPQAPAAGPQRMTAQTREDGSYEMLVDEPGSFHMQFESVQGGNLSNRPVEVPDAEAFAANFDFSGILLSGVVVDKDTEQPIPEANVYAFGKGRVGGPPNGVTTGADGRFQIEVDAGDYKLTARAEGYGSADQEVSVSAAGASDVRLLLARGSTLRGKVLDVRGRPVGNIPVWASAVAADGSGAFDSTLADGSFAIEGLAAESYVVFAGSRSGTAYGMAGPYNRATQDAVVRLRPASRVQVIVLSPDGTPLKDARVRVSAVNGYRVGGPILPGGTTTEGGTVELDSLPGSVLIEASLPPLVGTAVVNVPEGGAASVEIRLEAAAAPKSH